MWLRGSAVGVWSPRADPIYLSLRPEAPDASTSRILHLGSRIAHRIAGFEWKVEVVAHKSSEDGVEPVFLFCGEPGFHCDPGVVGPLPCSENGEYIGRTFQGW